MISNIRCLTWFGICLGLFGVSWCLRRKISVCGSRGHVQKSPSHENEGFRSLPQWSRKATNPKWSRRILRSCWPYLFQIFSINPKMTKQCLNTCWPILGPWKRTRLGKNEMHLALTNVHQVCKGSSVYRAPLGTWEWALAFLVGSYKWIQKTQCRNTIMFGSTFSAFHGHLYGKYYETCAWTPNNDF